MGQILSSPITTKHSTEGKDDRLMFGASSMQGWRISMEDAHTHILSYKDTGAAFFGVYDGHGGSNVAKYAADKLYENVIESEDFKKGEIKEALVKGFFRIDSDLLRDSEYTHETSGCTVIVALLTKENVLYVSNAGDSRAIICTGGVTIALSQDHKPTNPKETERINRAGGHVEFGRVNGNLALSRALGDFEFKSNPDLSPKEQAVTADPDVTVHTITARDEFMVLACDGIWDCLTNQQVASFIRKHVAQGIPLKEICEKIMDHCLADKTNTNSVGCDNMTIEIVAFLNGRSEQAWYEKIKNAVGPISDSDTTSTDESRYNGVSVGTYKKSSGDDDKEEEPDKKKHRGIELKSESRQYSVNELQNAPDLTTSLLSTANNDNNDNNKIELRQQQQNKQEATDKDTFKEEVEELKKGEEEEEENK